MLYHHGKGPRQPVDGRLHETLIWCGHRDLNSAENLNSFAQSSDLVTLLTEPNRLPPSTPVITEFERLEGGEIQKIKKTVKGNKVTLLFLTVVRLCGHVILALLISVTMKIVVFWDLTCGHVILVFMAVTKKIFVRLVVKCAGASIFVTVKTSLHVERMICKFDKGVRALPITLCSPPRNNIGNLCTP
jgi:hypothetical protein